MIELPIGCDNFGEILAQGLTFVDKSLFIKEFLDDKKTQVALITRPRRFGKTLNVSMLRHFFAATVDGVVTKGLFDNLKIAQAGDEYLSHQGQYPVVLLTLKELKANNFAAAYAELSLLISELFDDHNFLLESSKLSEEQKILFHALIKREAPPEILQHALSHLIKCLYQHYEQKVLVLIDEYDTPIQSAYLHHYYPEMMVFIRNLLSSTLKSNPYLYRALLTGILRVSKESLFSGLNNVTVYSVLDSEYGDYFGFTEQEVEDLFIQSNLAVELPEVRRWYNGYQIGKSTLYNPWSIASCLGKRGLLKAYWVNTSGNDLLKTTIAQASAEFKEDMKSLLQGNPTEQWIDENFVFADLSKNESAIWSLLLASGYLKATTAVAEDDLMRCQLAFPNYEVTALYRSIFKEWFSDKMGRGGYQLFLRDLLTGNVTDFTKRLKVFLFESMSQFDVKGRHPEKFYHGFVLGLMASLQETHTVRSNRESGYGRYDVMIIPKDLSQLGIVLEFKSAEEEEDLTEVAQQALEQVNAKGYAAELIQEGVKRILKLGLAFKGKDVVVLAE